MKRIPSPATCAICAMVALQLAACGTPAPKDAVQPPVAEKLPAASATKGGYLSGDGPQDMTPARLDEVPDAVPRVEPLHRYANRPYVALGKTYVPLAAVGNYKQRGSASWYGKKFHGQRTSIGEVYDMYAMTAAHPTLPIPSYARVTNLSNNKSVVVRVNDRGPFLHDRIIDLSYTAAYKLGIIADGSAEVEVESISAQDVGSAGAGAAPGVEAVPPASAPTLSAESVIPASGVTVAPIINVQQVSVAPLDNSDIWLQLGAFKSRSGAESHLAKMSTRLSDTGKQLKLVDKDGLVRVQIGPYTDEGTARSSAESMERTLGFKPMLSMP